MVITTVHDDCWVFGTDGSKTLGAKRWQREVRSYDERGNLTRTDYYNADGEMIISATGAASIVNTYDEQCFVPELEEEGLTYKESRIYSKTIKLVEVIKD